MRAHQTSLLRPSRPHIRIHRTILRCAPAALLPTFLTIVCRVLVELGGVSATKRSCQIKNIQRASGGMDRKELVHFAVVESLLLSSNRWCPYVTKPLRTSGKTGCLAPSEKKPVLLDRTAPPLTPEHTSPPRTTQLVLLDSSIRCLLRSPSRWFGATFLIPTARLLVDWPLALKISASASFLALGNLSWIEPRRLDLRQRQGAGAVARLAGDQADREATPHSPLCSRPAGAPFRSCSRPATAAGLRALAQLLSTASGGINF
jgi:hypothetical protein